MSRLWAKDEELAKKDDDLRAGHAHSPHWQPSSASRTPRRRSVLRLLAYLAAAVLLVVTLSRVVSSPSIPARPSPYPDAQQQQHQPPAAAPPPPPAAPPPAADAAPPPPPPAPPAGGGQGAGAGGRPAPKPQQVRNYNGPIKLPNLGSTIQAIGRTDGRKPLNRNVMFAAASLRSVATVAPMACQMARERLNYVHFVFFGRSDIALRTLLEVNGVDAECHVIVHDARPDYVTTSTETRMKLATARTMKFINDFMHPQAIVIDSTEDEETYFLDGLRDQIRSMRSALIELPEHPETRLSWISKLDSGALHAWDKVRVDVVIQAPSHGAGNINRLLRSLSEVDLGAITPPQLTIELPTDVDPHVEKLLAGFHWPPRHEIVGHRPRMLSLRRRIPRAKLTEEESSVRFLESFWPSDPMYSHVLVLSPHTEVTPQFFHYVKYALLEYRYSNLATVHGWHPKLMGLGFLAPTRRLDGADLSEQLPSPSDEAGTSLMWQAPNSDAMLFFGERWSELHWYVSQVVERQQQQGAGQSELLSRKQVSKRHPAWLEHVLSLSRLRGYRTVYPGKETAAVVLASHNDVPDVPDEYGDDAEAARDAVVSQGDARSDPAAAVDDDAAYTFSAHWQVDMLRTLPRGGGLPPVEELPLLAWDGRSVHPDDVDDEAKALRARFRTEVGGCATAGDDKEPDVKKASDLFCPVG